MKSNLCDQELSSKECRDSRNTASNKTLGDIIKVYNENMNDIIPISEINKKYQYIRNAFNVYGYDFIDAIIEICVVYKIRNPFAFFKTVLDNNIREGITTTDQLRNSMHKTTGFGREMQNKKPGSFNNFDQRDYDYDSLERKLLGWEK